MMTHCMQKDCGPAEHALADRPPGNLHTLLGEAVTGDIIDLFVLLAGVWGDPALPKGSLT